MLKHIAIELMLYTNNRKALPLPLCNVVLRVLKQNNLIWTKSLFKIKIGTYIFVNILFVICSVMR